MFLLTAVTMILLVALVVCSSLWWLLTRRKHAIDNIQGPPTMPVFGNALDFAKPTREEAFATINQFNRTYWPLYRTWMMTIPVIHPLDPANVELVLTSSQHITKSHDYNFISEWLGTGLLTSTGSKWHSRRKLLTPAFHFKILEEFIPVFRENIETFISKVGQFEGKQEGVDIVPLVTLCALDIICETAMGTSVHAQQNKDSEYVSSIYEIGDLLVHRMIRPWLYPKFLYMLTPSGRRHYKLINMLQSFTKKVIRERREELRRSKVESNLSSDSDVNIGTRKKTAFLDLLLRVSEEEGNLSDEDIREEVDTFMFEGHDTTAMAMSWAIHFLGCNPHVQEKCAEELREIFGESSDISASLSDLNNMKYLERVIKETLRLRPSVFVMGRKLNTNLKLDGIDFPAGTTINLHIYSIHRNPEIFPDPEKFDPDRFLTENCTGRHPYAYIPFSAGPRNCIGQKFAMLEMKSLLSSFLRNFRVESCNPERDYQAVPDLILRPKCGLTVRIYPRKA